MIDAGGPMISGLWMNKSTGKVVNVRDSVQDGDNMIIMTDSGTISMNEFSRDYIQVSDEIYDESGKVIENKPVDMSEISSEDDRRNVNIQSVGLDAVRKEFYNNKDEDVIIPKKDTAKNPNFEIIDKLFSKINSEPVIDVMLTWQDYPRAEVSTLVKYLDIKATDIGSYIREKYITDEMINEAISDYLNIATV